MGYTHSWYRSDRGLPKAEVLSYYYTFADLARQICESAEKSGIQLADSLGDRLGDWHAGDDSVGVNGYGEDSHESFMWYRLCPPSQDWVDGNEYYDFCKTARKPYDDVVTALLLAVKHVYGDTVRVLSDGSPFEWENGVRLFEEATGLTAPVIFDTVTV